MLIDAMSIGISEEDYWNMTFAELSHCFEAFNKKKKREDRERAMFEYSTSNYLACLIGQMLSGKHKDIKLEEAYSFVYSDEELKEIETNRSVSNFMNFANAFNQRGNKNA